MGFYYIAKFAVMRWSLYIGKISGIKIFIHWTFFILVLWIIFSGASRGYTFGEILFNLGFIAAVFACITIHEFGHALTAKRFNFNTRDITLLPIGGLARMEGLPERPLHEFLVAIMGPAVNIVIALILFVGLKLTNEFPASINDLEITSGTFWFGLFIINIFLALFNLIPAFPMDGGRILRALLSIKLTRARATRIAAYVGQFIAMVFVLIGLLNNPILALIGLFIFIGAQAEAEMEVAKEVLDNIKVKDLLMRHYSVLRPDEPISKAVSLLLDSQEKSFLVKSDNEVKGIVSKNQIIEGLLSFGKDAPVGDVMQTNFLSLHLEDEINKVMRKFSNGANTLFPVIEHGEVIGVLNLENINEFVQIQTAINKSGKFQVNNFKRENYAVD